MHTQTNTIQCTAALLASNHINHIAHRKATDITNTEDNTSTECSTSTRLKSDVESEQTTL